MDTPCPISETQLRLMKPAIKCFTRFHIFLYKWFGGQLFNRIGGGEICIVKMKGAKSGQFREFPLMYVPYHDGIVLVASLGGAPRHPVWYYNLIANPEIEVTVRDKVLHLVARLASAEEKEQVWPLCCETYPDFELYQRRTDRDIPVFICEPAGP